jgi:hypothetical protein
MSMARIMGCGSAVNVRQKHDFYETPSWCTEALLRVEQVPPRIWECCAGNGRIADVLRAHGISVVESDLVVRREGQIELDFLKARGGPRSIITNPPYRDAVPFIRKAKALGVTYLALLMKGDFLNAGERLELVTEYGYPARVWGLPRRPDFLNQKRPTMTTCWYVWTAERPTQSIFRLIGGCGDE